MTDLPRVEAHCQMDQPEEGVANGLWCCLHEAQVSHLEVPEGLAPALRQPAGRVLWGPLVCMLLTECHLDVSPQGYQLLHCKQTHACHQDLRLHCKVSEQLAFSGRSCAEYLALYKHYFSAWPNKGSAAQSIVSTCFFQSSPVWHAWLDSSCQIDTEVL